MNIYVFKIRLPNVLSVIYLVHETRGEAQALMEEYFAAVGSGGMYVHQSMYSKEHPMDLYHKMPPRWDLVSETPVYGNFEPGGLGDIITVAGVDIEMWDRQMTEAIIQHTRNIAQRRESESQDLDRLWQS